MSILRSLKIGLYSLSIVLLSSCSETIIREIPTDPQATNSTRPSSQSSNPSNLLTANTTEQTSEETAVSYTSLELDDAISQENVITAPPLASLSSTQDNAIIGQPGIAVDCANTVPCRWISEDELLSITVTNADNIASRERLTVQYRIDTLHDSAISLSISPNAADISGIRYTVTDQKLGTGNGISPSSVVAGTPITGSLSYDKGIEGGGIALSGISILDNGFSREAVFQNLPVGPAAAESIDCAFTLPCMWESPGGESLITLVSAGGLNGTGNLAANFTVEVTTDLDIALGGGSTATGNEGTQLEGRTHSLSTERGYEKLTHRTAAGSSAPGTVNFSRTGTNPDALTELNLDIYMDAPVPRWEPKFLNVPLI